MIKIKKEYKDKLLYLIKNYKENKDTIENIMHESSTIFKSYLEILIETKSITQEDRDLILIKVNSFINIYKNIIDKNEPEKALSIIEKRIVLLLIEKLFFSDKNFIMEMLKPK